MKHGAARAAVLVGALLGCDGPREADTSAVVASSDAEGQSVDYSAQRWAELARRHAARRDEPGPPLARSQFDGVFPPAWRLGDRWRALIHEEYTNQFGPEPVMQVKEFVFTVLREPDGVDGEYLVEALRYRIGEGRYLLSFSARDFSLIAIRAVDDKHAGETLGNGPHAFVQSRFRGAIVAFPVVPLGLAGAPVEEQPAALAARASLPARLVSERRKCGRSRNRARRHCR